VSGLPARPPGSRYLPRASLPEAALVAAHAGMTAGCGDGSAPGESRGRRRRRVLEPCLDGYAGALARRYDAKFVWDGYAGKPHDDGVGRSC
jgi:hypothetical protein